jgi:methyltransferase (TIGR00027 family)
MSIGKPSATARKVAMNILALGSRDRMKRVLPTGTVEVTARLLVAAGVAGPGTVRFARSRAAVALYLAFDWVTPGQFEAFGYRKAFCERQVRRGLETGARQVLVLGAGYDTLGWRLTPEFDSVEFYEIDHPATMDPKARGIARMGGRPNLHLLAADLGARPLADVLSAERHWDPRALTVIVAEGLLMYLPPGAVGSLLDQGALVTGPGSRLVFTWVGRRPDGRPDAGPWTGLALRLLASGGEPWLWGIRPVNLGGFLRDHGWTHADEPALAGPRRGLEFHSVAVKPPADSGL